DAQVRMGQLEQLAILAATHASRERFLTELTLDPPAACGDESGPPHLDEDYLVLSTIHSAKGQEWSAVHVLNVVDGCLPADLATGSPEEIEEERRLLYVAMTRACDSLALWLPQRFFVTQQRALGDRHLYAPMSRFITPEVAVWLDRDVPAPAPPDVPLPGPAALAQPIAVAAATGTTPLLDIRAALRSGWS
ncbi:MAG: ATP-dependent helicase, partial [Chitinophagaceae bacterium]|nr:ATP-dependent helicase [Rubrivivax sp.]